MGHSVVGNGTPAGWRGYRPAAGGTIVERGAAVEPTSVVAGASVGSGAPKGIGADPPQPTSVATPTAIVVNPRRGLIEGGLYVVRARRERAARVTSDLECDVYVTVHGVRCPPAGSSVKG
jgi:hypothetical protein